MDSGERLRRFTELNTRLLEEAGRRMEERLLDKAEIEDRDLNRFYGTLADKQGKLDQWGGKDSGEENFLAALARGLKDGGRISFEVEPHEVVDVTPEEEGDE